MKKNLVGKKAMIKQDNENENYEYYRGEVLIITYADNKGRFYDETMFPEMLCDFKLENGETFPFALYEYEFDLL